MTLKADNLIKSFGGLRAVDGVSFEAHAGALTCITGPNGAGKTTVFNLLTGFDTPDDGRILLDDHDITQLPPAARARAGVTRCWTRCCPRVHVPVRSTAHNSSHISNSAASRSTGMPTCPPASCPTVRASRWR